MDKTIRKSAPLLSIIIPVYKVEQTLAQCIESIEAQTFSDWEMLLIDDGSPDRSGELCDRWDAKDGRIRVLHKANGGLSDARNAGIDMATGRFLTFIDSDDYIAPGTLESIVAVLLRSDDCDMVEYPIFQRYGSTSQSLLSFTERSYTSGTDYWFGEEAYRHCYACNKVFRRSLFHGIRFPLGRLYEDVLTLPRLMQRARRVEMCNQGLYYYRYYPGSITSRPDQRLIGMLLDAHLEAAATMGTDLTTPVANRQYLTILNVQLDYYRFTHRPSSRLIRIPSRRLPLSTALSNKELLKILMLNVLGLKNLCRLYRILFPQ